MRIKKVLSVMLISMMLICAMGVVAFAEDVTLGKSYISQATEYNLAENDTLTVTGQITVESGGSLTVNGGNVAVSNFNADWVFYAGGGSIVFNNVNLTATSLKKYLLMADWGNSITFNNCTITVNGAESLFYNEYNSGYLNLNNTKVYMPSGCQRVALGTNSKVNLTNGSLIDADGLTNHGFRNVDITVENSTIDINGCETGVKNTDGSAVVVKGASTVAVSGAFSTTDSPITMSGGSTISATSNATITVGGTKYEDVILLASPVAKIGEEEFETLQAAIDAVKEGDTIVLLDDIEITSGANGTTNGISYTRDASFNIDLNGKTVSSNLGNNALRFKIGGDGTAVTGAATINVYNGKVVSGADNWCAISAAGTSDTARLTLNLKDLIVENSKGGDYAVKAWEYAKVTAENVTVNSTYGGGVYAAGGEVVLNDNVVVNQKGLWNKPYQSMAVAVSTKGKATVNSGTYTTEPLTAEEAENQGTSHGSWAAGVMNSGGTLIINGGTFANGNYGDDSLATAARGMILADTYAVVEINGGTFNALKGVIDYQNNLGVAEGNAVVTIKGGTYSANPIGGYVALPEGYSNIKDFKGNYVIGVAPTATVNNLGSTVIKAGEYRNLSFQTVYDKDMPLSFVMQFLANQTAEDMVTSPYADWYGDFVITFTGIEAGSFEATGCYLAGYYGDFGWIQVPVDDMTVHNGVRYPVMLGNGAGQKYDYICESVKDFRCAMYLTPEILENNPNIKVSLELSVVDNSAGSDAALDALVSGDESVIHKVGVNEYVAEDFVIKEEVLPTEVYVLYNDTPLTVPESIQEKYDYEEGYKVRLYAGIDKLSYKDLGFMAKLVDPTKNYETDWVEFALEKKVVYKEITVTTKEKTETLTPEMFPIAGSGVELNYLFPMNIWVPSGDDGYSAETYLIVRPFSRAFDGTTVLGESYQTEAIGK